MSPHNGRDGRVDEILNHAARLFAARGYHAAGIRDLCSSLGVGPAALYHHVCSKEECLRQIQERTFQALLQGAQAAVEGAPTPPEKLSRFIEHHLAFFLSRLSEMRVLSHESEVLTGAAREQIDGLKREYTQVARSVIAEVAGIPAKDAFAPAMALLGALNWVYTWYDPERGPDVRDLSRQFSTLFLQGLPALREVK